LKTFLQNLRTAQIFLRLRRGFVFLRSGFCGLGFFGLFSVFFAVLGDFCGFCSGFAFGGLRSKAFFGLRPRLHKMS
jgi:hypothetical protein